MIAIKAEIDAVAAGEEDAAASALRRSPHTAQDLLVEDWDRPYSREHAAYPLDTVRYDKYWVPVGRVDNAFGDRNIVCACPPIEAYMGTD